MIESTRAQVLLVALGTIIIGLLAMNLIVQFRILERMPPTVEDMRSARSSEDRAAIMQRVPLTRIDGSVSVYVQDIPLMVEVMNTPLSVEPW